MAMGYLPRAFGFWVRIRAELVDERDGGVRSMSQRCWQRVAIVLAVFVAAMNVRPAIAETPAHAFFRRTWERADKPVADGGGARTWMWGPEAISPEQTEPYSEGEGGGRQV